MNTAVKFNTMLDRLDHIVARLNSLSAANGRGLSKYGLQQRRE